MCRKLFFLTLFVLLVSLNGAAQAEPIDVNNPSFEYDVNGVQIAGWTGLDKLQGWSQQDPCHWGWGWDGVSNEWGEGYEAADGTVSIFLVTAGTLGDLNDTCELYQILEDAEAVIAENRRYTLTFNALRLNSILSSPPIAYGALYYSVGEGEANDVILSSESKSLTSATWGDPSYSGWEEVTVNYIALSGESSIGETLGIKLSSPYPWLSGYAAALDNVRVESKWASDAWDPNPADGEEDVARDVTLSWRPGLWPQNTGGHEVYFGTSFADVNDATTSTSGVYQGAEDINSWSVLDYDANGLALGATYYWRIDEVNEAYSGTNPPPPPNDRWKGEVWSFVVTGQATNPVPSNGATGVPVNVTLSWTAGTDSDTHDVYLGTDEAAVESAGTGDGEYKGSYGVSSYTPSSLLLMNTTYYWRIDEVNDVTVKGKVWRFTTSDNAALEDFDGYADTETLITVWLDDPTIDTKALVYLDTDPNYTVDGNSMRLNYYNDRQGGDNRMYSETEASASLLEGGTNWLVSGAQSLMLNFRGVSSNSAQPIYFVVEDGSANEAMVTYDDTNGTQEEYWHEWNIDLADFSGVNLSNVSKVYLGVGYRGVNGSGGYGDVYFDEFRLYPSRCMPDLVSLAGDFDNDCDVDGYDLEVMANEWLVSDFEAQASPPASAPEVWYRFDLGTGKTIKNDGTWSGYDITISSPNAVDEPTWTSDVSPAIEQLDPCYAIAFDGALTPGEGDYLSIPNSAPDKFTGTENMTITAWIKPVVSTSLGEWDFPSIIESRNASDAGLASGLGFGSWGYLMYWWNNNYWDWNSGLYPAEDVWSFIAVTVEPTQAVMYLSDGSTLQSATNAAPHSVLADWDSDYTNLIGLNPNGLPSLPTYQCFYFGLIDDLRMYNKTLTYGEIMGLSGIAGEVYVPNESVANIAPKSPPPTSYDPNDPDIVNFKDYTVLADGWLSELLWP